MNIFIPVNCSLVSINCYKLVQEQKSHKRNRKYIYFIFIAPFSNIFNIDEYSLSYDKMHCNRSRKDVSKDKKITTRG